LGEYYLANGGYALTYQNLPYRQWRLPVLLFGDQENSIALSLAGIGTEDDEYLQDLDCKSDTHQMYLCDGSLGCISRVEFRGEHAI
jgi:hypothetical protein